MVNQVQTVVMSQGRHAGTSSSSNQAIREESFNRSGNDEARMRRRSSVGLGVSPSPTSDSFVAGLAGIALRAKEEKEMGNARVGALSVSRADKPPDRSLGPNIVRFAGRKKRATSRRMRPTASESEEDFAPPRYLLTPDQPFRMSWDMCMLVLIIYNVFAVPVSICFQIDVPPTHPWFWFEFFFDLIFLTDVVINFNTAVQTETGLEYDRLEIARTYLSFWFWIDFPSSIPLSQGFKIAALVEGGESSGNTKLLSAIKLLRIARILKLIRLMKAAKIVRILEDELDINVSFLKLFKLFFSVLFVCHLIGCLCFWCMDSQEADIYGMFRSQSWYGCEVAPFAPDEYGLPVVTNASVFKPDPDVEVQLLSGRPRAPLDFCDTSQGNERWMYKMDKGWLYLWVLYWTITTMTTIGYGDFSPMTPLEVIITIAVQLIGAVLFGWIIGNIANLLADFNQYETAYKLRMEQVKSYLVHKKVPKDAKKRVRKYCAHYFSRKGVMREDWHFLPPRLKRELLTYEHADFLFTFARLNIPGFDEAVFRLAESVRPVHVPAGERFVDGRGEPCTEICFVSEGDMLVTPLKDTFKDEASRPQEQPPEELSTSLARRLSRSPTLSQMSTSILSAAGLSEKSEKTERGSTILGVKRPGTWFGHIELLKAWDRTNNQSEPLSPDMITSWQHNFKARTACDLLLLVKDDLFILLEDFPYLRDVLELEPQLTPSSEAKVATKDLMIEAPAATADDAVECDTASGAQKSEAALPTIPQSPVSSERSDSSSGASLKSKWGKVRSAVAEGDVTIMGDTREDEAYAPREYSMTRRQHSMRKRAESDGAVVVSHQVSKCSFGAKGGMNKSPKLVNMGVAPGLVKSTTSAASRRSSWQKLQTSIRHSDPRLIPATSATGLDSSDDRNSGGWLKQRIATELLGDAPCAPWEIDETVLFERLASLITSASSIVDEQQRPSGALTASSSSSASSPEDISRRDREFAIHSLLLSMQRNVLESSKAVRAFLDDQAPDSFTREGINLP